MKNINLSGEFLYNSLKKLLITVCISFLLLFLGSLQTFAALNDLVSADQQSVVKGIIKDSKTGESLPGVNIVIKGTTQGVISDAEGNYSLSVSSTDVTLVFSFVGYVAQEIPLAGQSVLDVSLVTDIAEFDEVVVVGYGTMKKINQTGSIVSLQTEELTTYSGSNLGNSLAGKLPGLRVMQIGGEPGKYDSRIDIRGWGNMLVIIDGVPRSDFQRLDPRSIASISVLKDASAAVYGVKAANGVMLITTKSGQAGKSNINFNYQRGVNQLTDYPKAITNSKDNLELLNEAALVAGTPLPYPDWEKYDGTDPNYPSVDYWNTVFRKSAPISTFGGSIDGGNQKVTYRLFGSILREEDAWKQLDPENESGYNRYNFGANLTAEIYDGLTANFIFSGLADERLQPYITTDGKTFRQNYMEPSYIPIYANNNPEYYNDGLADFNPLAIIDADLTGTWEEKNKRYQSTFSLVYDLPFVKGLQLKGLVAYDAQSRTRKMMRKFYNEYKFINDVYKPTGVNSPSNLVMDEQQQYLLTSQVSVNYKTTIADNHNITGLLLGELRQTNGTFFSAQKNFDLDVLEQLNAGLTENAVASGADFVPAKNLGLVGRVNYEFATKYLAEVSFRYDGSSLFPSDSRWGFFPAFSLGWRMSEESFIKDNLSSISNFKLRLSHGTMGDDAAANGFEYMEGYIYPSGSYMFSAGGLVTGASSRGLANPNITWYTATTSNVGFDLDIRQSLLYASFDLFRRERNGLLATRAEGLPSEFGATLPQENLNSDLSTGYEIVIGHKGTIGSDFLYEVSANLTYARTKWLYREVAPYGSTYSKWRNDLSNRWSNMRWGLGYEGQFQTQEELNTAPAQNGNGHAGYFPGDMRYEDWNEDGMISGLDERPIGRDNNAEIFYGLDMNATYKGFALTLFWQGATHYTLFPTAQMRGPLMWGRNSIDIFMDRWHHEDPLDFTTPWVPGKFPISRTNFGFAPNQVNSEYMFQDIWYLRLKNVELSYTLPIKWSKKVFIKDVRIFTNATNLLTFKSKEAYFDPEKRLDGDEAQSGFKYPLTKNYNLGIDITF